MLFYGGFKKIVDSQIVGKHQFFRGCYFRHINTEFWILTLSNLIHCKCFSELSILKCICYSHTLQIRRR